MGWTMVLSVLNWVDQTALTKGCSLSMVRHSKQAADGHFVAAAVMDSAVVPSLVAKTVR